MIAVCTPMMSASIFRPPMVSSGRSSSRRWSDVMYGSHLCSVDDDRVAPLPIPDWILTWSGRLHRHGRRCRQNGCTRYALIAHGSEVVGMHGLVLAVPAIIFNYDGQNLAAVRMQARLDCLYLCSETVAWTGALTKPPASAIGCPRSTVSPTETIGFCRCADAWKPAGLPHQAMPASRSALVFVADL